MLRRILDSPWLYFALAGVLVVVAVATQIEVKEPSRPMGTLEDLAELRERDDINVVFMLIDTLRADHLSLYGYERNTSPILDGLAANGVVFRQVESQSSWTKASMASLWTSMYPQSTGVKRYPHAVPEEAVMPAEILRDAGFRTGGIWRNGWVSANFGFSQGFEVYMRPQPTRKMSDLQAQNPSSHKLRGTDLDITNSAVEFIRSRQSERFFLYLHYMDAHQYLYDQESTLYGSTFADFYDNAIHWTDRNLGQLLIALDEFDLLRKTIIVIASDHGEAFFEHGVEGHAKNLYAEVQRVPLVFVMPFAVEGPTFVEPVVANVDIWPTIFDLLGIPVRETSEGRSLVPLMMAAGGAEVAGTEELTDRTVYSQVDRRWGSTQGKSRPLISAVREPYRLIHYPLDSTDPQLYDFAADRLEKNDIAGEQPEVVANMMAEVETFLASPPIAWDSAPEVALDEMRLAQLRALGYAIKPKKKKAGN